MRNPPPIIAIAGRALVVPGRAHRFQGAFSTYVELVRAAGGAPVILAAPGDAVVMERVDGLLLTGGEDVGAPDWWEEGGPDAPLDPARDATEISLVSRARRRRIPLLGVCRGAQLINGVLGGSLRRLDAEAASRHGGVGSGSRAHRITLVPDDRSTALGGPLSKLVLSRHAVGLGRLGRGLRPAALAEDGSVEAFVATRWPCLGIMWHAEYGEGDVGHHRAPFDWLIAAARKRMAL